MATFTVKVTLSGSVAGRTVLYTHTGTFTGIEEVGRDNDRVGANVDVTTQLIFVHGSATNYRGESDYSGTEILAIANKGTNIGSVQVTGTTDVLRLPLIKGLPFLVWYSHDYDAAFMYDATTPAAPDNKVAEVALSRIFGQFEYDAIALFRAIT